MRHLAILAGKLTAVVAGVSIATLITVQFAHLVAQNIALYRQVRAVQADVIALHAKESAESRTIERLRDDAGAIPEIHDRLHVVGPHEAIIYLKRRGDADR